MGERISAKDYRGGLFAGGQKGPQAMELKEQPISKSIQDYLDKRGIYNDRLNSGRVQVVKMFKQKDGKLKRFDTWLQLAKKGTPDRFCIIPPALDPHGLGGWLMFIEVKRPGKKPTPEQNERHQELRNAGAVVIVADSLESFIAQFERVLRKK
jgi:hypothetical protein